MGKKKKAPGELSLELCANRVSTPESVFYAAKNEKFGKCEVLVVCACHSSGSRAWVVGPRRTGHCGPTAVKSRPDFGSGSGTELPKCMISEKKKKKRMARDNGMHSLDSQHMLGVFVKPDATTSINQKKRTSTTQDIKHAILPPRGLSSVQLSPVQSMIKVWHIGKIGSAPKTLFERRKASRSCREHMRVPIPFRPGQASLSL